MNWENWQEDYSGKTRLKDWWKMIKINLGIIKDNITGLKGEVDKKAGTAEMREVLSRLINQKANKETPDGGFQAGRTAEANAGGAVGQDTLAGDGFAGGKNAKTAVKQTWSDGTITYSSITAVQLGEGLNSKSYTAQIFDYKLVADDAKIPTASDGRKYLKDVGKLSSLQTTEKSNIVGAVNELKTQKVDKESGKGLSTIENISVMHSTHTGSDETEIDDPYATMTINRQDGKSNVEKILTLAHRETFDHPDGSVTEEKLSSELLEKINALHGFGADFWTGFFKTGRTDFSYAFINNGAVEIKPTQAINATVIKYMLLNCSELADASPIVVNLSADNPVVVGVCMGCSKMTKPPVINFTGENAHVCRSYVSAYANCAKLTQCTIWFGDGTQSASGERTDMANTFLNCSALTSLTFSGSGSPKSLDLSACKLLSNESIQSLYNALMDVSTVTSGTYKITINSDIQTKITALSLDFAAKGWTLEVKQEETSNA